MSNQTRVSGRAKGTCVRVLALVLIGCASRQVSESGSATVGRGVRSPPSSAEWLALLPAGEEKRRFILDCTGCHQFDHQTARVNGVPRTRDEWQTAVARMMTYAGATTSFPVISAYRNPDATADWLSGHLTAARTPAARRVGPSAVVYEGAVAEFMMPEPRDLPHDVAVDGNGQVVVTGMMSHRMYALDPTSRRMTEVEFALPIPDAVPYVVRIDHGNETIWIGTGAADVVLHFDPRTERFTVYELPSKGALVRHLSIDPRTHHVWAAYGASPGIPARVARITPRVAGSDRATQRRGSSCEPSRFPLPASRSASCYSPVAARRRASSRAAAFAKIATSTRRFCCRPASLVFSATGSLSPRPYVFRRLAFTPSDAR
jgi:hypothetical protein